MSRAPLTRLRDAAPRRAPRQRSATRIGSSRPALAVLAAFWTLAAAPAGAVAADPEAASDADAGGLFGLPDFSGAGYRAGEAPPPRLAPTLDVRDFGAIGDGETDDTEALRRALAAAARAGGGVVSVPEGRWVLRGVLTLDADGVVLQGAGPGRTVLVCPAPLAELLGESRSHSWSGGLVRIQPARGGGGPEVGRVRELAPEGADELALDLAGAASPPAPGEWLELALHNDRGADTLLDALYGGVVPRERMGDELREADGPRVRAWVRVTARDGERVAIEPPLRLGARPAWRPTLRRRPHVREVGVEGLTFEFPGTPYPGHLQERGYNALQLRGAIDCWVREVETINADSGVFVGSSTRVTVDGLLARGRMMHHVVSLSWSSDSLVTNFWFEAPHVHGTTVSWSAHGNVFSRGGGLRLAMDAHRAASFENLHTDILVVHGARAVNPLRSGGSRPRGPHAARRQVYWNVVHLLPPGDGAVRLGPYPEWPQAVFAGWRGTRPLRLRADPAVEQRVLGLNAEPAIPDLHQHQRRARAGR